MNQIKYAHTLNTQLHAYHGDIALTHVGENKPWDMHELWISYVGLGSILFYIYIYIHTHTHTLSIRGFPSLNWTFMWFKRTLINEG